MIRNFDQLLGQEDGLTPAILLVIDSLRQDR
jgi:hypothetical protein